MYASQFRRTADTLAPLAERLDQEVRGDEIARGDIESWARGFAARLLRDQAGRTVVVAGHSNTVPLLISALGVEPAPEIPHWQHDNLFVVTVSGGAARLLHMHYGATSAAEEP